MKPINYLQTIIYRIVCKDLNISYSYVGHTTNFTKRKSGHKTSCNNVNDRNYNIYLYQIIRETNWDNWDMIEIEKFPCKDGNEARARERYWIEFYNSNLNCNIPNRTKKEYYVDNKKQINEKNKINYQQNKEHYLLLNKIYCQEFKQKISIKRKFKIICECGCEIQKINISTHRKSLKHLKLIELKS
jgi:hypothetical protein